MNNATLTAVEEITPDAGHQASVTSQQSGRTPDYDTLEMGLHNASRLIDDIVLKKYLYHLNEFEVIPLDDKLKKISYIRLFKITEMVYQKDEYSTYKFASVFSAVQNLNCGIFIVAESNGMKTDFYMGVRSFDNKRTTKSLKDTLKNALKGQFPGVKCEDLLDTEASDFISGFPSKNVAAVSCVANNKDDDFKDNLKFIQGLEKFAVAMQGQKYTAVIIAQSMTQEQLDSIRGSYENIYTQLSPFSNMQVSYGTNTAMSISDALSHGITSGTSYSQNVSSSKSSSSSTTYSQNNSTSQVSFLGSLVKSVATAVVSIAGIAAAPVTEGLSLAAAGVLLRGLGAYQPKTNSSGTSTSTGSSESETATSGKSYETSNSTSDTSTHTTGVTTGKSDNMQLTMQNKALLDTLTRIDSQLKRIDECESLGMWESAAYFMADSQETAEMAAGTYKAMMKGTKSGLETSAINFWGKNSSEKLPVIQEYIKNFIHPIFAYHSENGDFPVMASSLVSSNELAIQMGLPRKSVCGFPVVEHADFGKEVVSMGSVHSKKGLKLGKVFSMGAETQTDVMLDVDSLASHTFITGSTGSGKSNTIYGILGKLRRLNRKFLVIEPAKGEYKNIFGHYSDVSVYGTNPSMNKLLRINPFSFPAGIHIYEHIDRLIEIFNACWPMYAAMPAVLKDAVERAYESAGWDLRLSKNRYNDKLFPNFADVLREINTVMDESEYSSDSRGDYKGSLCTRIRSLTNGINSLVFTSDELSPEELFDRNVIADLSRVGSVETKSLIMGILIMKLQEYRMTSSDGMNQKLSHVTVLEEAHNLLKRTSTEQSSESSNLIGKSVEMLTNAIAEMRTYGEGFIIADQAPGLLDMAVIRNTNTKIILRLPDFSDRQLVGRAAGLTDDQIIELSKLPKGVAAVYQNDWVESVLCKVERYDGEEINFGPDKDHLKSARDLRRGIVIGLQNVLRVIDRVDDTVIRSDISARAKCAMYKYLETPVDYESRMNAAGELVAALFDCDKYFSEVGKIKSVEDQRKYLLDHIRPELTGYSAEEINRILTILVNTHTNEAEFAGEKVL